MQIDKYDRQIRLWGHNGQKKLSKASICLIGCSGSGIEALKNLVLPGVNNIHIYDESIIQIQDLSSSFFYTPESVGEQKGSEALKNLLQLNPDVTGQWHKISPNQFLKQKQLNKHDLIICCEMNKNFLVNLSRKCWQLQIPLICSSSVGFMFYVRNQKKIHYVQNQPGDQSMYYLRIGDDAFERFKQYSQKWQLKKTIQTIKVLNNLLVEDSTNEKLQDQIKQQNKNVSKIPYIVILHQVYRQLQSNQKTLSNLRAKLKDWTDIIHQDYRTNFREAQHKVYDVFRTTDNFIQDMSVFQSQMVKKADQNSDQFCLFLKAVSIYLQKFGVLPQPSRLPDMETNTVTYIELKSVYKQEHKESCQKIIQIISEIAPTKFMSKQSISSYIENINALQIVSMSNFSQQLLLTNCQKYLEKLQNWDQFNVYLSLRAYEQFVNSKNRPPLPQDQGQIRNEALQIIKKIGLKQEMLDQRYIKQICRASGKQLIFINSMQGAIIAQQAIKLITNTFCPMLNEYFFNGINSSGSQISL